MSKCERSDLKKCSRKGTFSNRFTFYFLSVCSVQGYMVEAYSIVLDYFPNGKGCVFPLFFTFWGGGGECPVENAVVTLGPESYTTDPV